LKKLVCADPAERAYVEHLRERQADIRRPYQVKPLGAVVPDSSPRPQVSTADRRASFGLLCGAGIAAKDARELAELGTHAQVAAALRLLDRERVKNPGGFLRKAITEAWTPG
jgi:hypothetical protein